MGKTKKLFQTAFNEYSVVEQIKEGGSAVVYRVRDEGGRELALKLVKSKGLSHQRLMRFQNELMFCSKNEHPNIIKILDSGFVEEGGIRSPFYVMPLYPTTLRNHIENGLNPQNVLPLFSSILDGIECAHLQGVIHRDLKPENILVDAAGRQIVICDFGIAHFSEDDLIAPVKTTSSERLANFAYASPEQRKKGATVDKRSDIYSLGLILNEMFTGHVPIGTGFSKIVAHTKEFSWLDDLVDKMLQQSGDSRPQSIKDIKNELIGRREDFIIQQRLDVLKKQVVPASDISDPLVLSPPEPLSVNYRRGEFIIELSVAPDQNWAGFFRQVNFGSANSMMTPDRFHFSGNKVSITCDESYAEEAYAHFKRYREMAIRDYRSYIENEQRKMEEEERKRLRFEVEEEERRQRVMRKIKL